MRRLILALVVIAVMATTTGVVPQVASAQAGTQSGGNQIVGQPTCGPWQIAWYVSYSGWWYGWSWRWCHNPSLENPWYVDWASWAWGGYAGPDIPPGYKYSVPAGSGPG